MPARLHYQLDGPAKAPVVVFGPALGTELELFTPQVAALAGTYRIVRYDLRGHGRSEVLAGPYTIGAMAADVIALLDALGIERFCYVGVSIGGAIGQWLGLHHADRLEALVLCSTAAQYADPASWPQRAARVRAEGTEFLVESRTGTWYTPGFVQRNPRDVERLLQMLRTTPREGYAGGCEAIGEFDFRDRLAEIATPTLAMVGEKDPATPVDTVKNLADGIPRAGFVIVPDASHLFIVEKPGTANAAIAEHLRACVS